MSDRSPIPNLPPLAGVQDPAVRAYLDAFTQGWTVRNGQTRNTDEKFLTVKDLKDGIAASAATGAATASNAVLSAASRSTQGVVNSLIQGLIDSVMQSRLYKLLGERIAVIETPEWFRGRFGAEVQTIVTKQENATNALAAKTDTAITNINGNIALAQQELKAVSDTAGATASQVTSLQTEVNGVVASAQQALSIAQSVDGQVDAAWTVKFDANGYVTGAGLGLSGKNGSYSSDFTIRADRFSIAAPIDPNALSDPDVPFVFTTTTRTINGATYPPGAWIKAAYIADLSVTRLKIYTFNALSRGSVWMTNGVSNEVNVYHGLGRPVIPVIAWDTPGTSSNVVCSMVLTYLDSNSLRFVMYANTAGVGYTGTVSYGYGYI